MPTPHRPGPTFNHVVKSDDPSWFYVRIKILEIGQDIIELVRSINEQQINGLSPLPSDFCGVSYERSYIHREFETLHVRLKLIEVTPFWEIDIVPIESVDSIDSF